MRLRDYETSFPRWTPMAGQVFDITATQPSSKTLLKGVITNLLRGTDRPWQSTVCTDIVSQPLPSGYTPSGARFSSDSSSHGERVEPHGQPSKDARDSCFFGFSRQETPPILHLVSSSWMQSPGDSRKNSADMVAASYLYEYDRSKESCLLL